MSPQQHLEFILHATPMETLRENPKKQGPHRQSSNTCAPGRPWNPSSNFVKCKGLPLALHTVGGLESRWCASRPPVTPSSTPPAPGTSPSTSKRSLRTLPTSPKPPRAMAPQMV